MIHWVLDPPMVWVLIMTGFFVAIGVLVKLATSDFFLSDPITRRSKSTITRADQKRMVRVAERFVREDAEAIRRNNRQG
ncbi:MAG: hypothetical protein A2Z11_04720 [Candidatus Woykebacteria bacterium RBG_16_43_9]|uniref:Uncharacterized protein n=1 Tax=Candidatus Woykebacteria bacterium RBG_16_43_9 TaxID=1802596 RepID=A0A1G1WDQ8_9BACT|nr:MAG: hypothetical protein A2Z11_04720 [Candidatus Woykebacteria bacterium RBG_16_43_9]